MPGTVRTSSGSRFARPHRAGFVSTALISALLAGSTSALAQEASGTLLLRAYVAAVSELNRHELATLALTLGAIAFAVLTAIMLVRTRAGSATARHAADLQTNALQAELDRMQTLLYGEPQVLVVWRAADDIPEILGDDSILGSDVGLAAALLFDAWLPGETAEELNDAVNALRMSGEGFALTLTTSAGRTVEAEGRAIGGRAVLRIKDVSGAKRELAALGASHRQLAAAVEPIRALLDSLPAPVWTREPDGRLAWVNAAYARAVDARDPLEAVARQLELLERSAREELGRARQAGQSYSSRIPVVMAGSRCFVDVFDVPASSGSAGIGIDVTEAEALRTELTRMMEAHRRTLDQLPTAVAIFTAKQRLAFSNSAYRTLWGLEAEFLEQQPTDGAILDRLREHRKLPEQADFRQWRNQLFEAYRTLEPKEHWWHLPDGRTLRVVTSPNAEGGITYVFDDVTERLDLERKFDALIRVQGETLDNLTEAVAVFGSDGRLRLSNPAFARLWKIGPETLGERPHIEDVVAHCRPVYHDDEFWQRLRGAVTGLDARSTVAGRLERNDGSVVDCATLPLPDGATLVTFQDVTDSVNVERALRERNDALEAADELKNEFVHHVSYELRTPLTNIIGFAHLLYEDGIGPLTAKQREYLGYISSSSAALLAIINDILDLASIDAGAMKLDLGPVDIRRTIEAAAEGVRDRLAEHDLTLAINAGPDIGTFTGDERRVRQILFNLLSNAIAFSPAGGTITLAAERRPDAVVLSVADRGRGIPDEIVKRVFKRFETHALGSQHRGAGLGLSIVRSFVELHGGTVTLASGEGQGTTVSCFFPLEQTIRRVAAE